MKVNEFLARVSLPSREPFYSGSAVWAYVCCFSFLYKTAEKSIS